MEIEFTLPPGNGATLNFKCHVHFVHSEWPESLTGSQVANEATLALPWTRPRFLTEIGADQDDPGPLQSNNTQP